MTKKRQRYMTAQSQSYHFTCPKVGVASVEGRGRKRAWQWILARPLHHYSSPVLSCLLASFGVPADRSKTVLFMPKKWAWPSKKGACQGGIKGARCPTPCHAPLGSLGGDSGPFLAGKSPFFAIFVTRFLAVWCPESGRGLPGGAWLGAPPPMGPLGGLGPVGFTGF